MPQHAVRQDLGRPRGGRRACSTSTCTSSTRSRARRPSTACASPGAPVRRPDRTLATADHNVPTDGTPVAARIRDELSRVQVETLERNCEEFGIPLYSLGSDRQGIVHVIGPELGVTQPGMTIVCGDSHTATHGAFGALAFGIGTSEVEHVLATQCLVQRKPEVDAHPLRGRPRLRRHRQGPHPRHDRPDGRRRRRRPRRRVRRPGHRGALDGGPHDGLQHDDRGRRPRRHGRARRDDLRLGAPSAAPTSIPAWRELRTDDGATLRPRGRRRRRRAEPDGELGDQPRRRSSASPTRCPSPRPRARSARWHYMDLEAGHADPGDPPRPRVHRLVHELAHRRPARRRRASSRAARSPPTSTRWSSPARCR